MSDRGGRKFVGAHVSVAGGVDQAPPNAAGVGARAFAMFTKNQRQWVAAPYTPEAIKAFRDNLVKCGFTPDQVLPHDGYLINLANPDTAARAKSLAAFIDELVRCGQLGLTMLNLHPGSSLKVITREAGIKLIVESLNRALAKTAGVAVVIENTAGQGSNLGSTFEELAAMVTGIEDQSRVGICLDTCHMFAAGYDLRTVETYAATMAAFDRIVGLKYLRGMHLNDAKAGLNSHVDRHESLGKGTLGMETFRLIMNDRRLDGIPLVLETPDEALWPQEIKLLYKLVG